MNPFILTSYLSPKYFCDREQELSRLISSIENKRNTVLISRRRMGKTGLIKHLEYNLKNTNDAKFIYFDILSTQNADEFIKLFANALFSSFGKFTDSMIKNISKVFSSFRPSFTFNPMTGDTNFNIELGNVEENDKSLKTIFDYIAKSDKKFIIAIDEFQQITEYPQKKFESLLRSYIQHLNNVVFIYSGSSRDMLNSMFANKSRPFYLSSEIMYLESIDMNQYCSFIIHHFEDNEMQISAENAEYIIRTVKNHTFYVQLLCNRLFSKNLKIISEKDVKTTFYEIIEENKYYYENYRNVLTDYQWKLLKAIASEDEITEINAGGFISKYNLGSASSVNTAVKSLIKKEIIIKENQKYKIDDLLLSNWLALQAFRY
jgi:hypothetical protein